MCVAIAVTDFVSDEKKIEKKTYSLCFNSKLLTNNSNIEETIRVFIGPKKIKKKFFLQFPFSRKFLMCSVFSENFNTNSQNYTFMLRPFLLLP